MKTVQDAIFGLFAFVLSVIAAAEAEARSVMVDMGLSAPVQNLVLLFLVVALALVAFRLLGPLFGILIAIFALLLVIHVAVPGLAGSLHLPFR